MKFWSILIAFVVSSVTAVTLLAWFGLPYQPLSSIPFSQVYQPEIEKALVTVSRIEVKRSQPGSPWSEIIVDPVTFDLADVGPNGISAVLGAATVDPGVYEILRFHIDDVQIKLKGEAPFYDAKPTPPMIQLENLGFEVCDGLETKVLINFNANQALVETPPGSRKFNFKADQSTSLVVLEECVASAGPRSAPGPAAPLAGNGGGDLEISVGDTSAVDTEERAVQGFALLQGRGPNDHSGTEVSVFRGETQIGSTFVTEDDGGFSIDLSEEGGYQLRIAHPGWLTENQFFDVFSVADVGDIVLPAGDADADDDVDTDDLILFKQSLDQIPPPGKFTDPTGDGRYDIHDVALAASNLSRHSAPLCGVEHQGDPGGPAITGVQVSPHPDNSLIMDFDVDTDVAAQVYVEYDNPLAGSLRSMMTDPADTSNGFSIVRLRALNTYCYQVIATAGGLTSDGVQGTFTTGPLPLELGSSSFTHVAGQPTSYPVTLLEHALPDAKYIIGLDSDAQVVWYYRPSSDRAGAVAQDPSTLNIVHGSGNVIREVTALGEELAVSTDPCTLQGNPSNGVHWGGVHHEVLAPKDGKVLYLGRVIRDPFNDPQRLQQGDTIRQWDQLTGQDVVLFDTFDHIDPVGERTASSDGDAMRFWGGCDGTVESEDWTHANSIQVVEPRGNIIMSIRHLNTIISIAPDYQSIEWRLGGPSSDFTFVDADGNPDPTASQHHQHSARELPNGNIVLFDNGNDRLPLDDPRFSRGLELALDFDNMTTTVVWESRQTPDLYAQCCSNVTRLENRNTVLVYGSQFGVDVCCRTFTLVEADPDGDAFSIIEISAPGKNVQYRVYPYDTIYGETER